MIWSWPRWIKLPILLWRPFHPPSTWHSFIPRFPWSSWWVSLRTQALFMLILPSSFIWTKWWVFLSFVHTCRGLQVQRLHLLDPSWVKLFDPLLDVLSGKFLQESCTSLLHFLGDLVRNVEGTKMYTPWLILCPFCHMRRTPFISFNRAQNTLFLWSFWPTSDFCVLRYDNFPLWIMVVWLLRPFCVVDVLFMIVGLRPRSHEGWLARELMNLIQQINPCCEAIVNQSLPIIWMTFGHETTCKCWISPWNITY